MEEKKDKKWIIGVINFIMVIILLISIYNMKEKPQEGYIFVKQCTQYLDSEDCTFIDESNRCYHSCDFGDKKNITTDDLINYCSLKQVTCKDFVKLERKL